MVLNGKQKLNTKAVGQASEAALIARFCSFGVPVFIPFGDNERFDLLIESDGHFLRVQVKTGRYRNGAVLFKACSNEYHRSGGTKDYRGQCDLFGVYCPQLDRCYLVPIEAVGTTQANLRIDPPSKKGNKNIRWAKDYEI